MSSDVCVLSVPRSSGVPRRRWWSGLWAVPSVRWAVAATMLFLGGLAVQLSGGPTWLMWALYLACYVTGGWEPALEGLLALRGRALDVDLLMIVAAIGAAAIGQIFDGALLIVIFATSGALEDVATRRTEDSVRSLLDLTPEQATRIDADGAETVVDATALRVGDVIAIRPGERIAADATVLDGASDVDQSSITGEPLPVATTSGGTVYAGTLNGTGALRARVDTPPGQTVVARIVAMAEEASATKASAQLFIEKVEHVYSVVVVGATLALFGIPLAFGADLQPTLLRAMTFMIVASPCAVVLATMPPLLSAIATAGRRGVLVKSAVIMEKLADIGRVALDKTGTLTTGRPTVTDVVAIGSAGATEVLGLAAAAEQHSEHPLGRAIVAVAREQGVAVADVTDFGSRPGVGVHATLDGRIIEVVAAEKVADDPRIMVPRSMIDELGGTGVGVRVGGEVIGVIGLHDRLRSGARDVVGAITVVTGTIPVLLTGDNHAAAQHIADSVGIRGVGAQMLPEQKVDAVNKMREDGAVRVAVVGDGINDAPALATADVGIAMGRIGADLTLATADVVIVRDDLAAVPAVLSLARRVRRVVIANLVIASTFIAVLVTWDLVGHLPLPLGVAGHEGSTVIVALNGLRLLSSRAWPSDH